MNRIQNLEIFLNNEIQVSSEKIRSCISSLKEKYPIKTILDIMSNSNFVPDFLEAQEKHRIENDELYRLYSKIVNRNRDLVLPAEEDISKEYEKVRRQNRAMIRNNYMNEYFEIYERLRPILQQSVVSREDWKKGFEFYKKLTDDLMTYYIEHQEQKPVIASPEKKQIQQKSARDADKVDWVYAKGKPLHLEKSEKMVEKKISNNYELYKKENPYNFIPYFVYHKIEMEKLFKKKIKKEYSRFLEKHPESQIKYEEFYKQKIEKIEKEKKQKKDAQLEIEKAKTLKKKELNLLEKERVKTSEYKRALVKNPTLTLDEFSKVSYVPREFEKEQIFDISEEENEEKEEIEEPENLLGMFKSLKDATETEASDKEMYQMPEKIQAPIAQENNNDEVALTNSLMCSSALNKKKCVNRNCKYAHTLSELKPLKCSYGRLCRKITCVSTNLCINRPNSQICNRIHHGETLQEYLRRMGIKFVKQGKKLVLK